MVAKKRSSPSKFENAEFVEDLLEIIKEGKKVLELGAKETLYSQGDQGRAVYFIKNGKVRISVVSAAGKEATLLVLGPRDFFGEGCLVGHTARLGKASTLEPSTVVRVDKSALMRAIDSKPEFAHKFIGLLLARNTELEEDLCDQLFYRINPSLLLVTFTPFTSGGRLLTEKRNLFRFRRNLPPLSQMTLMMADNSETLWVRRVGGIIEPVAPRQGANQRRAHPTQGRACGLTLRCFCPSPPGMSRHCIA